MKRTCGKPHIICGNPQDEAGPCMAMVGDGQGGDARREDKMPDVQSAAQLAQYVRISRLLAGRLDFQSAIDAVAKEIKAVIPHDHMDVCIISPGSTFHIAYESGLATDWSRRPPASIRFSPLRDMLEGAFDTMLTGDACTDPRFHFEGSFAAPILEHRLRARLHAALKVHGETIGVLSCSRLEADVYTQEDLDRACLIADLIAPYFYALRASEEARKLAIIEAEARVREETLRQGARQLTEELDAERQRIGMELHDQTLADLTRIARRLERLSLSGPVSGAMLEPLSLSLQQSMQELRQIIEQARPSVLQLFGLAEAIETHLGRAVRDSGLTIRWAMEDATGGALASLPPPVSLALYRIAQEAINNAVRHSQASRITVRIWQEKAQLYLEVSDTGIGLKAGRLNKGTGIGNMQTRASLIAASFSCGSGGRGSYVRVILPLPPVPQVSSGETAETVDHEGEHHEAADR